MAYNHEYPYVDLENANLDFILLTVKEYSEKVDNFIVMEQVKYAEPIEWSIDTQYQKNTIVQYNNGETTYLSKQPVPAGILITDTDYWLRLADYAPAFTKMRLQIVPFDIEDVSIAPVDIPADTILWYRGALYKANTYIYEGDTLRPNVNLTPTNVLEWIQDLATTVGTFSQDIQDLQGDMTTAQTDITTLYGQVGALQTKSTVLVKNVTLYAADWAGSIYTITDSDITATAIVVLATPAGISPTQLSDLQGANIIPYGQSAGQIQIAASGTAPTVDVPVQMLIYRN